MNRLFRLQYIVTAQSRYFSAANKGFIKNILDNLKKEYEGDKHIKENLEQFRRSTKELEQSEEFKKMRDLYKKMEQEIPADTGDKILTAYRTMMEKLQKETDRFKRAEMISKGLENVNKVAESLSLNIKDSEVVKQALKAAETVEKELRTDRYTMYCAPEVLRTREEVAGKAMTQKVYAPNETEAGVVVHKDSRWVSAWKQFKDNNRYVQSAFDLKTRIDEGDGFLSRSARFMTDRVGGLFSGLVEKSETQRVLEEVLKADPSFSVDAFMRYVQFEVVPNVLEAVVRGDEAVLASWCHEAVLGVLCAPLREARSRGLTPGGSVLDVSGLDLVAGALLDQGPVLVLRFESQEVRVLRDRAGAVVEGDPGRCLRLMHTWAMCRDPAELHPWAAWRLADLSVTPLDHWF